MNLPRVSAAALRALFASAAVAGAPAAQTYVVNAQGGPGAAFTSIATAVAAVPNGAILLVAPGTYGNFTIHNKSLAVLGGPGVLVSDIAVGTIAVTNLSPTQRVTLHGLAVWGGLGPGWFNLNNCQGVVHVQACLNPHAGGGTGGRLVVQHCSEVRVTDSWFEPPAFSPLAVTASTLFAARTRFAVVGWTGYANVSLTQAQAELVDCTLGGGAGALPVGPSLQVDAASSVCILGASVVQGGAYAAGIGGAGIVVLDPGASILGTPAIEPTITAILRHMPALNAPATPIGVVASATLTLPPGSIGGLFAGMPLPAHSWPGFPTPLVLDPATIVGLASGTASALSASYVVPNLAALRGVRVGWQGFSYDPGNGLQASNGVVNAHW